MQKFKKKLLIVDAPGGPHPSVYLSMLPLEIDVLILIVKFDNSSSQLLRITTIGEYTSDYVITNMEDMPDVVRDCVKKWSINGILVFSERIVCSVGKIAHSLNLPSNHPEVLDILQNKSLQRKRLLACNVEVPNSFLIKNEEDLILAAEIIGFPAVLKPSIGMGSLSVFEIIDLSHLKSIYALAKNLYITDSRVKGISAEFLLEEKIIGMKIHNDNRLGDYVSVESLVNNGNILHLTVTDKLLLSYPFRENGQIMPSCLPEKNKEQILNLAEQCIKSIGILNGAVHTEIKLTNKGASVIEVNGRIGGAITELLRHAANYNVIKELAHIALGEPICQVPQFFKYSAFLVPQPPAYRIKLIKMPTKAELLNLDGIVSAEVVFSEGEEPDWRIGTASNLLRIIAVSDKYEYLLNINDSFRNKNLIDFIKV